MGCAGAASAPAPPTSAVIVDGGIEEPDDLGSVNDLDAGADAAVSAPPPATSDTSGGSDGAVVTDEMPYAPGARSRIGGSVAASAEDETIARWNRGGTVAGETDPAPTGRVPHPAPRIKVDVLKVSGHISEAEVLRQARSKGYWPFRLCYEEGLRRAQKLHGTVRLRVTVGSNGSVRGSQKVAAEVDDPAVVACVVKAARSLSLPAPDRGAPSVTLEVSLWPGDDAVPSPGAKTAAKQGGIDVAALQSALRGYLPQVRVCLAEGQKRHPGLWGRIGVRLRIRAAGEIVDASEIESHFPDPDVTFCVMKSFAHNDVPSPHEELVVVYPLRLGGAREAQEARP
jgi:hypothetical protein